MPYICRFIFFAFIYYELNFFIGVLLGLGVASTLSFYFAFISALLSNDHRLF